MKSSDDAEFAEPIPPHWLKLQFRDLRSRVPADRFRFGGVRVEFPRNAATVEVPEVDICTAAAPIPIDLF